MRARAHAQVSATSRSHGWSGGPSGDRAGRSSGSPGERPCRGRPRPAASLLPRRLQRTRHLRREARERRTDLVLPLPRNRHRRRLRAARLTNRPAAPEPRPHRLTTERRRRRLRTARLPTRPDAPELRPYRLTNVAASGPHDFRTQRSQGLHKWGPPSARALEGRRARRGGRAGCRPGSPSPWELRSALAGGGGEGAAPSKNVGQIGSGAHPDTWHSYNLASDVGLVQCIKRRRSEFGGGSGGAQGRICMLALRGAVGSNFRFAPSEFDPN